MHPGQGQTLPLVLLPFAQAPSLHSLQHTGILPQNIPPTSISTPFSLLSFREWL